MQLINLVFKRFISRQCIKILKKKRKKNMSIRFCLSIHNTKIILMINSVYNTECFEFKLKTQKCLTA